MWDYINVKYIKIQKYKSPLLRERERESEREKEIESKREKEKEIERVSKRLTSFLIFKSNTQ